MITEAMIDKFADDLAREVERVLNEESTSYPDSVFRPKYRELTEDEQHAVDDVKALAAEILRTVDKASHDSRCACLARTRLEEAVMWAVKSIT